MRLLDASILRKQPAPFIGANTNIVNQDSEKNHIIGLLDISILGEQLALSVGANTEGETLQKDNSDICNNGKSLKYPR